MILYPAIELRRGKAASTQGETSPEERALECEEAKATWVQVVDVDGAMGDRNQWAVLPRILGRRLRVQFGGGIRSMLQVQQLLELGVERVVVGTQAVLNPAWVRELCRVFPGRIVLALDAEGRRVVVKGRREPTQLDVVDVARQLDDAGLAAVVYTNTQVGARLDRAVIAELRRSLARTDLVVAGRVTDADLEWLQEARVAGAVLGLPADGSVDLRAAVARHPQPRSNAHMLRVLAAREDLGDAEGGNGGGVAGDADGDDVDPDGDALDEDASDR